MRRRFGYLRSTAVTLVGLIQQDVGILVEDALRLSLAWMSGGIRQEESRRLECELPVVFVDIEQASLRSYVRSSFCFVDRCCNSVDVEDARSVRPPRPAPMIVIGVFIMIPSWSEAARASLAIVERYSMIME